MDAVHVSAERGPVRAERQGRLELVTPRADALVNMRPRLVDVGVGILSHGHRDVCAVKADQQFVGAPYFGENIDESGLLSAHEDAVRQGNPPSTGR